MINRYQCVIVANGRFPESERVLNHIRNAEFIIACDGAIENLYKNNIPTNAIVGDLDSIPAELSILYKDILHKIEDQEINDLTKAVCFALENNQKNVLIVGATGYREDHCMGNIALLMDYAVMFDSIELMSDYGVFTPLLKSETLESFPGQQVSIFSMSLSGTISSEGLKWKIENRKFNSWWEGTLNEATDYSFSIMPSPQSTALVYRAF